MPLWAMSLIETREKGHIEVLQAFLFVSSEEDLCQMQDKSATGNRESGSGRCLSEVTKEKAPERQQGV